MRIKEFIIFIVAFTVVYFAFFFVYDVIHNKMEKSALEKRMKFLLDANRFARFAAFYGLTAITVTSESLFHIYTEVHTLEILSIAELSEKYHLSIYEFIVIIVYFEYCSLMGGKSVSVEDNKIQSMNTKDQELILRYGYFLSNKDSYDQVLAKTGNIAANDLKYFDVHFLFPGVRVLNSTIYYVGDIDEKK